MLRSLFAVAAIVLSSSSAFAARHVWTGAVSGNFSDSGNWIGGSPAGDDEAELSFPASVPRTALTNDIPFLKARSIAFSGAGYSIDNYAIWIRPSGTITDSSGGPSKLTCNLVLEGAITFVVNGEPGWTDGLIVESMIAGTGPVMKTGPGMLTFSGSLENTYSGTTFVAAGELQLSKHAFLTAVPGDLVLMSGEYYYGGVAVTRSSEQIADDAEVKIGSASRLYVSAIETLGPLEIERGGGITTTSNRNIIWDLYTGRVILGGDVAITRSGLYYSTTYLTGNFELPATRTFTVDDCCGGGVQVRSLSGSTPGAGVIVRSATNDSISIVGDYTGPTTLEGAGDFVIHNPGSDAVLRGGTFRGTAGSLTAYSGLVQTAKVGGDLRIGAGAGVAFSTGWQTPLLSAGGTIRLGGTLGMSTTWLPIASGKAYHFIENRGTHPILGAFSNAPEGAVMSNGFKASYVGQDGNDVTLIDARRFSSTVDIGITGYPLTRGKTITLSARVQTNEKGYWDYPTGNVTFSMDGSVIATKPIGQWGTATTDVMLTRTGSYTFSAHYASTATVDGGNDTITVDVAPPPPALTAIEPASVLAGETVTLKAIGTDFTEDTRIVVQGSYIPTTFVSPAELRGTWVVPKYEVNVTVTAYIVTPNFWGSQSKTILITGVPRAASPLSWETSAVSGTVTPGAQSVWLRGSWRALSFSFRRETQYGEVLDNDHDGVVRWLLAEPIPIESKFLMIDVQTGTINTGMPNDKVPDPAPFGATFVRGPGGTISNILLATGVHDLMWVRPGVGAWRLTGGSAVSTSAAIPLYGTMPPPAGIEPGDVVAALRNAPDFWYGGVVDEHIALGPGVLRFTASGTVSVTENDAVAKLKVVRTDGADGAVSVNYTTVDDTAIAGVHYEGSAGTVTFAEGEIEKWIEIPILNDSVYGGTTQFKVRLSDPVDATLGTLTEVMVRIQDADALPVVAIGPDVTMEEGDGDARQGTFTVTLSGATRLPVTINWSYSETWSYNNGQPIVFEPGETEKTITVPFRGNTTVGPDRTFSVSIWLPWDAAAKTGRSTAKLTVLDDDEYVGITILDTTVSEAAGTAKISIALSEYSQRLVTLSYGTESLTAFSGRDYSRVRGSISLNQSATIEVPILNDTVPEPDESFLLVFSDPVSGRLLRSSAVITIADDDPQVPPTISIEPASVHERHRETAHARFVMKLSHPTTQGIWFYVRTVGGTATSGSDFSPMHFWSTGFAAGRTSAVVDIPILDDQLVEQPETFRIEAFDTNNVVLAQATATIYDDDGWQPVATIENAEIFEGNSGLTVMRFVLRLTRTSNTPITVAWETAAGTADFTDFQTTSGQTIFAVGETSKTLMVNVIGDEGVEPDETFEMRLTSAVNTSIGNSSATGLIRNDDQGPKDGRR